MRPTDQTRKPPKLQITNFLIFFCPSNSGFLQNNCSHDHYTSISIWKSEPEGLSKEPSSIHTPQEGKAEEPQVEILCAQWHFLLRGHFGTWQVHSQMCSFIWNKFNCLSTIYYTEHVCSVGNILNWIYHMQLNPHLKPIACKSWVELWSEVWREPPQSDTSPHPTIRQTSKQSSTRG